MSPGHSKNGATSNPTTLATVYIVLIVFLDFDATAKPSTIRVQSFRSCTKENGANVGHYVVNSTVHKSKYHGVIEGNIQVLKNMKPPLPADITIFRCRNSAVKECVSLLKYKHNNICPFFVSGTSNALWKDVVDKFVPPLTCPVKKGEYKLQNGTFDDEKFAYYFQAVPGEQAKVTYFVIKIHSKVNEEDMVCMEITFRQVRS